MPLSSKDKASLYHELGTLLASGFHLDRGVELLLSQNPSSARRQWLEGLKRGLSEKLGVAESLERYAPGTSGLETGLLVAGECGGRLEHACKHIAEYFELRQKSFSSAMGAMIYPMILAHMGCLFPDLSKIWESGGLGAAFSGVPLRLAVLWTAIAVVVGVSVMWSRAAKKSVPADRLLGLLPLIGSVRRHWALARFTHVMHTSLLAALKISEALRLAGGATQSAVLDEGCKIAAKKVEEGENFTRSLRAGKCFSPHFVNSMETAEQAGTLDIEFQRWARAESELAASAQNRAAEWLPRIFYVFVVIYIAWRIIGTFAGYYGKLGEAAEDLNQALHSR